MEPVQRLSPKHNYTIRERLAILAEYEQCLEVGQKSAFCRRMGVSSGSVARWARQKRAGLLVAGDGKENAYMMKHRDRVDYERLKRENEWLKVQLERSESAVEVLGKASALLEALAKNATRHEASQSPDQQIPATFRNGPERSSEQRSAS